jgi:hypothetical protein
MRFRPKFVSRPKAFLLGLATFVSKCFGKTSIPRTKAKVKKGRATKRKTRRRVREATTN